MYLFKAWIFPLLGHLTKLFWFPNEPYCRKPRVCIWPMGPLSFRYLGRVACCFIKDELKRKEKKMQSNKPWMKKACLEEECRDRMTGSVKEKLSFLLRCVETVFSQAKYLHLFIIVSWTHFSKCKDPIHLTKSRLLSHFCPTNKLVQVQIL